MGDRRTRRSLPRPGVPISGRPISHGLVAAFVFSDPEAGLRDRVSGVKASGAFGPAGSTIRYAEPDGAYLQGLYLSGSYVTWQAGATASPFQLANAFSVCWGGDYETRATGQAYFWSLFTSARTNDIALRSNGGALTLQIGGTDYNLGVNTDTYFDGGTPKKRVDGCVSWSSDTASIATSINGVLLSNTATTTSPTNLGTNPYVTVGTSSGLNTNEAFPGVRSYLYVFNRNLSAAEKAAIAENPAIVFAALPRQRVAVDAGGGSGAALTGVQATGAAGSAKSNIDYALTGVQAAGQAGSVSASTSQALTGNQASGSAGNVTPNITVALTGVQATGAVGNVSTGNDVTLALTGVSATGAVGSVGVQADVTRALTGVAASGQVGFVSASGGDTPSAGGGAHDVQGISHAVGIPLPDEEYDPLPDIIAMLVATGVLD